MTLRSLIRRLFEDRPAEAAPPSAPSVPAPPIRTDPGLRDAVLSGWFLNETGELFRGFPIVGDDIVLDVGCGDGGNANFCASRGAALILADIDRHKVAAAVRRLDGSAARSVLPLVSDANPLPLPDGVASKIVSTEVIEHVDDPAQFLAELVRVGRSGARYLLTVPDPVAETLQKDIAPQSYFEKPNHVRIVERDEFVRMVTDAGLVIERRDACGFYWSIWWLLFWPANTSAENPSSPLLENWARTWDSVLDTPQAAQMQKTFDKLMPKTQIIIARKP